jgi:hypothetical protein
LSGKCGASLRACFENAMFTLIMLMIACAAIIGFCAMFALLPESGMTLMTECALRDA